MDLVIDDRCHNGCGKVIFDLGKEVPYSCSTRPSKSFSVGKMNFDVGIGLGDLNGHWMIDRRPWTMDVSKWSMVHRP